MKVKFERVGNVVVARIRKGIFQRLEGSPATRSLRNFFILSLGVCTPSVLFQSLSRVLLSHPLC